MLYEVITLGVDVDHVPVLLFEQDHEVAAHDEPLAEARHAGEQGGQAGVHLRGPAGDVHRGHAGIGRGRHAGVHDILRHHLRKNGSEEVCD